MIRKATAIVVTLLLTAACEGSHRQNPVAPTSTGSTAATITQGISAVAASTVASSSVTITWTTDALSDSRVDYGPTEAYGESASGADSVTSHFVNIAGLAPGTSYHFKVTSTDSAGAVAMSDNYTFTTLSGAAAGAGDGSDHESAQSVLITSPARDATVSGAVTVSASTGHDGRVAGVQFKLDGADLGSIDERAPFSVRWNTKQVDDGRHTITAVVLDESGEMTASASVRVTVRNGTSSDLDAPSTEPEEPSAPAAPPRSGSNSEWPSEPDGFRVLSDQSWNSVTGGGWNYRRRQSSKNADIVSDSSAPESPSSVLRMIFTTDMDRDSEPGVHWMGLSSRPREIFTGWWMKLSSNWRPSPAGGGKITFLWATNGQGQVYANLGGSNAPHRININTEWGPYGQKFWEPNVSTTRVSYNEWYRVEWYVRWESRPGAGDGIMRWWVNGVLNGDYRNVRFPDSCCFEQFEFAPTLQNPPTSEQYMYIDHTYVSAP